jgi:outer membrane receptor protein involved in Fe transport
VSKQNTIKQRLFSSTIIFGAAALSLASGGYAAAQAPATPAQPSGDQPSTAVHEVVVTGSRIKSPNLTSDAPITSVSAAEVKLTGTTTVENLLNQLPSVVGGQNLGQSIDSSGTATVNLRGLGANRTLVLVDGRRLPPGDPTAPYADINQIPAALVDRVDVVTGGASAVYGADAVAGVVNFIMKKDFQGVQFDLQASANQNNTHSASVDALLKSSNTAVPGDTFDGEQYTASAIFGVSAPDGKGNITAYASYFHSDPVLQTQRDYSACALGTTYSTVSTVYNTHFCVGSSNGAYGRFQALSAAQGNTVSPGTTSEIHDNPNGSPTFVSSSVPGYNFNALSYLQREDDRYNLGYFAHYQVSPQLEFYSDFMFAEDNTTAQFAPSGFFAGGGAMVGQSYFNINCNNPLLSAQQATALCGTSAGTSALTQVQIGYRFTSAPRTGIFDHTSYKADFGARGDLDNVWSYDAYIQYGTSSYQQEQGGYASLARLQNALEVNPNGTCYVGGQCVPINIFTAQSASISKAAFNYVLVPGFLSGDTVEQVASANINGDLGKYNLRSPFATEGVGIALGTEYRRENLLYQTDAEESSGDLSGGGQNVGDSGTYQVYELFGEARVPLVQDLPFIKSINFNPGYRFSDYTSIGITNTYKLDFDYSPSRDIRFRYSYNVAVRAPNIDELYTPQVLGLFGGQDPCAGSKPTASQAVCAAQGVTAAQYGTISQCPAAQCGTLAGGNPNLKAETADTYTYGFVATPRWIPRLSFSADYYNIRISNLVEAGLGGASAELDGCATTLNAAQCSLIHRDPATGELFGTGYVSTLNTNNGFIQTKGIDVAANYTLPVNNYGRVDFKLTGTYTAHYVQESYQGSGTYDCAGLFGVVCNQGTNLEAPLPHWRSNFRVTWTTPWKVTASVQWRFIGATKLDIDESNPLLQAYPGLTDTAESKIGNVSYFDATVQWKVRDGLLLRGGVNNIFDINPPFGDANNLGVFDGGNANTYPQLYDTMGRNMFVGMTADF